MNKNDLGCDVHMYKKNQMQKISCLWLRFLGGEMCITHVYDLHCSKYLISLS
jgi:hypothetical protein